MTTEMIIIGAVLALIALTALVMRRIHNRFRDTLPEDKEQSLWISYRTVDGVESDYTHTTVFYQQL